MSRCHLCKCLSHLSCIMCACVWSVSLSSCQNVILIIWNNVSSPLPSPFCSSSALMPFIIQFSCVRHSVDSHTPLLLCCQAQSEAGSVLIFSHLCQAPCCCCKDSLLPSSSALSPAPGPPLSPGATGAQYAAQSICHQLSAFSRAMMCGEMGKGGRGCWG